LGLFAEVGIQFPAHFALKDMFGVEEDLSGGRARDVIEAYLDKTRVGGLIKSVLYSSTRSRNIHEEYSFSSSRLLMS
jgi:hypothetical protein